ncbi:MAG: hypothetical protein RLN81_12165 [Balneolaceae bacterium]
MDQILQKRIFTKHEIYLKETKVKYKVSKIGSTNEVTIPFENIEGDVIDFKSSNMVLLYSSIFMLVLSLAILIARISGGDIGEYAEIVWLTIGIALFIFYLLSRKDLWKIKLIDNNYIYLHKNLPNTDEPKLFIDEMLEHRNQFLKKNYGTLDPNLNYEVQLNKLRWLKSIEVLNQKEFDAKYEELKGYGNPDSKDIGFN